MITKENYEAYLLDKAEGNLSEQLLKELEFFLKANPQLQPEEDAYDEAFVMKYDSYEPLPYENELLKKPVIIPLVWKTVSIAASIALLIGVFFFLQPNNNQSCLRLGIAKNYRRY